MTTLTLVKLKDEEISVSLTVRFSRIVLGHDVDGDEISTLIVDSVEKGADVKATALKGKPSKSIPEPAAALDGGGRAAIDDAGKDFPSFADGPIVRAVDDEAVRRDSTSASPSRPSRRRAPTKIHERDARRSAATSRPP